MIEIFREFWQDYLRAALDILLVSYLVYQILRLLIRTRAVPIIVGIVIIVSMSLSANWLKLHTVSLLFDKLFLPIVIAMIISLQPELRRMFYSMGQTRLFKRLLQVQTVPTEEILQACLTLSDDKTGALIVLEKNVGLRQIVEGGIAIQSKISRELLTAVFYKGNPLHDGAVVISGNLILAAACYLPLSNSQILKRTHGARHRAALGVTEESDALAIVVSEEKKGHIAVCFGGDLQSNIDSIQLKSILMAFNSNRLEEEWALLFAPAKNTKKKVAK